MYKITKTKVKLRKRKNKKASKNLIPTKKLNKNQTEKFDVCNDMVNIPLIYYLDIIKKCNDVHETPNKKSNGGGKKR